jgi:S-disulfanyl-L-cysteine oxidoreductase SoxD
MWKYLVVLALMALASATPLTPVLAQDTASKAYNGIAANKTIWDGVYTDEQAAAGQMIYASGCSVCHGKQLEGVPDEGNPALAAASFMIEWDGQTMADLVRHIHAAPNDQPGDIDPLTGVQLAAFILNQNGVPPGKTPLSTNRADEAKILFTERKGAP